MYEKVLKKIQKKTTKSWFVSNKIVSLGIEIKTNNY